MKTLSSAVMLILNIVFLLSLHLCFTFDLPQKCVSELQIDNDHYNVSETYNIGNDAIPTDAHTSIAMGIYFT